MKILHHFESGVVQDFEVNGNKITFDLRPDLSAVNPGFRMLNVQIEEAPSSLKIRLLIDSKSKSAFNQGLLWGSNAANFQRAQVTFESEELCSVELTNLPKSVRIANYLPYGRDALDRLLIDTRQCPDLSPRLLSRDDRSIPVFEFGQDDGKRPMVYIIAGEDVWETAGSFVVDKMIRSLCQHRCAENGWLERAIIRLIPVVSLYSASHSDSHYDSCASMEGVSVYGAAMWGDESATPEMAMLCEMVVESIRSGRFATLLTLHSWHAHLPYSEIEAIQSAGDNRLEGARLEWTQQTIQALIKDVPRCKWKLPEKIWYPASGLAREYLLREFNVTSFRIEITTHEASDVFYQTIAEKMLHNMSEILDWSKTCGD